MKIYDSDYNHGEEEWDEMRNLLIESHKTIRKPFNWRLALFENWLYASRYLEPPEYFLRRVHLWRNESGKLVAFLIRGNISLHLQMHPDFRHLEKNMLDWAEQNWFGDKPEMELMVYDWDTERQALLAQRGFDNHGAVEDVRTYDLSREYPEPVLPSGFRIVSLAEIGRHAERIELENSVWGVHLDEAWFRGKSSSPSYSFDWDVVVLSPEGKQVAYSLLWLYPHNHTAEFDPIGTHPDFRKLGLSRAVILECFRRLQASGIQYAYIASETEDPVVSHLYTSLGPVETYQGYRWVIPLH
jgi:mycothiol synthase